QTTASRWLNTTNSLIPSSAIYFDTGERASSTDPLNHTTNYTYDSAYAGAYVTRTCNALSQCVSGAYDFNTGLLTSLTDLNSNVFTYTYDNMLRLTQGNHPDGGSTKFTYPTVTSVQRQRLIAGTTYDTYKVIFDGLGRPTQTQQITPECTGGIKIDTAYDVVGRTKTVSNPYCLTTEATYGITQQDYDALSRVTKTTKQDGSIITVKYEDTPADI